MKSSHQALLAISLTTTALPTLATSHSFASVTGLAVTITDLDPLDGVDAGVIFSSSAEVVLRSQFNSTGAAGQIAGQVQVSRNSTDAYTLIQSILPEFGGTSIASLGEGWNGSLESASRVDAGGIESFVTRTHGFELLPGTAVTFSGILSYDLMAAGAPNGGNTSFATGGSLVLFNNFENANLSGVFAIGQTIQPLKTQFAPIYAFGTTTFEWSMLNASAAVARGSIRSETTAGVVSTIPTIPEAPSSTLLLFGIGALALSRSFGKQSPSI